MNYAVIGTGAVGGYYGSKLMKSGKEVHFLLHRDYEFVKQHGLQINSYLGNFHLDSPSIFNSSELMPKIDVVIVGLKTVANHLLKQLLPPLLKSDTIVVLIQNGVGVEEDVQKMFPNLQLVAGLAFICSSKTNPGVINHQCYGKISLANYSCKNNELFKQIIDDFKNAEIPTYEVEYNEARWKKAVWNMPFNGMTVAMNVLTDELLNNPEMRRIIRMQMLEVIHAAQACGVKNINDNLADSMIEDTLKMVPYAPSMKLDYDFKRPMEIYYLYSRPIQIAREHGFEMSKLEMLEAQLLFKEQIRHS